MNILNFLGTENIKTNKSNSIDNKIDILVKDYTSMMNNGEVISAYCYKANQNGDLLLDIESDNVVAVIPRDEVTYHVAEDNHVHKGVCYDKVGTSVNAKILKVEKIENNGKELVKLTLSRKLVIEEIRDKMIPQLEEGKIITGRVVSVQPIGAFIDIGGDIQGLIPNRFLDCRFIADFEKALKVGDIVTANIFLLKKEEHKVIEIGFDRKNYLKFIRGNVNNHFKIGDVVVGTVTNINFRNNLFNIDIGNYFDCYCDYNGESYKVGDKIRVKIRSIREADSRIKGIIL